ncbi:hypothetical protein [Streptomyces sp. ISL-100]|uniref:hypothetical protein n=1 Tax=Streptomyces sp. ISL-100 TaxID=2819173 RepID=UPI001BEB7FD9|nr:hypothetical protein [Streptomyces sp. ISL-100]MBT2395419.1 hypothetical protein [Streptomyces sp. ISL-100]
MLHVVASCTGGQAIADPDVLVAAFRQADEERGRLEHVRVHVSRAGASGVLFLGGMVPDVALEYGRELFEKAVMCQPELAGWSLSHCALLSVA